MNNKQLLDEVFVIFGKSMSRLVQSAKVHVKD